MKACPPRMRLLSGAVAVLLIAACGDATESTSGKSRGELETKLQHAEQSLMRTKAALADAERRVFSLRREQDLDRGRIAELKAGGSALERQNREFREQLARARSQLAQSSSVERNLRQQNDQNARRAHDLGREHLAMRASLARAYNEIQRLRSRQGPNQRQMAELYQRGAAASRELGELRRYNGSLLQERSNLQAWLQEANAARARELDAMRKSLEESERIESEAQAANGRLRAELGKAGKALAEMTAARDKLDQESRSLRASVARSAESERSLNEQLAKAIAHSSALSDANARMATGDAAGDTVTLRAQLAQATGKIDRLRAANDYLVEKIEICNLQQPSSHGAATRSGWRLAAYRQAGPEPVFSPPARFIAVASDAEEQPKSTRREKELDETKQKLKKLEQEKLDLTKTLQERETECAAAKKQVETLTWANEVLVKELDAAYASGDPAAGALPKGARGIYRLRQGESLSRVAKAFYGNSERWRDLVEANKDKIPDPDRVVAGTIILIPE